VDLFPNLDLDQRAALLDEWVELRREIARAESRAADLIWQAAQVMDAEADERPFYRESIYRSTHAEYSAAGRISMHAAEDSFIDSRTLQTRLPEVRAAFALGDITARHVHEIVAASLHVSEAVRNGTADADAMSTFDVAAAVIAEQESPWRTRVAVKQLAASLANETIVERSRKAHAERGVSVRPVGDSLALLQMVLPEHLAVAVLDRLTRMAKAVIATRDDREPVLDPTTLDDGEDPVLPGDLGPDHPDYDRAWGNDDAIFGDGDAFTRAPFTVRASGGCGGSFGIDSTGETVWMGDDADAEVAHDDQRTLDQIRADIVTDLLLAADPGEVAGRGLDHINARIQVTVAASTLAGDDEHAAELDGHGPIDPDAARLLAGRTSLWSRLFLDHDGMVTATDAYSPTENMKRFLCARDQRCRFPGCQTPAHRTQMDHNHDWALGGRTELSNLALLCPGHHVLKHPDVDERHRWSARMLPGGDIEWTSPLGHSYVDPPPRRVMFV